MAPDYIVSNWSDELFALMVTKLSERKKRETEAIRSGNRVSDTELFNKMGVKIKHGD